MWATMRALEETYAARMAGDSNPAASDGGGAKAAVTQHLPQSLQLPFAWRALCVASPLPDGAAFFTW